MEGGKIVKKEMKEIKIPHGHFCENCSDGCRYWNPSDKDGNGRQYCGHYSSYYYPRERQGCLSFKK